MKAPFKFSWQTRNLKLTLDCVFCDKCKTGFLYFPSVRMTKKSVLSEPWSAEMHTLPNTVYSYRYNTMLIPEKRWEQKQSGWMPQSHPQNCNWQRQWIRHPRIATWVYIPKPCIGIISGLIKGLFMCQHVYLTNKEKKKREFISVHEKKTAKKMQIIY